MRESLAIRGVCVAKLKLLKVASQESFSRKLLKEVSLAIRGVCVAKL